VNDPVGQLDERSSLGEDSRLPRDMFHCKQESQVKFAGPVYSGSVLLSL